VARSTEDFEMPLFADGDVGDSGDECDSLLHVPASHPSDGMSNEEVEAITDSSASGSSGDDESRSLTPISADDSSDGDGGGAMTARSSSADSTGGIDAVSLASGGRIGGVGSAFSPSLDDAESAQSASMVDLHVNSVLERASLTLKMVPLNDQSCLDTMADVDAVKYHLDSSTMKCHSFLESLKSFRRNLKGRPIAASQELFQRTDALYVFLELSHILQTKTSYLETALADEGKGIDRVT